MTTQENTISAVLRDDAQGRAVIRPSMTLRRNGVTIGEISFPAHLRVAWAADGSCRHWIDIDPSLRATEFVFWRLGCEARRIGVDVEELWAAVQAVCRMPDGCRASRF